MGSKALFTSKDLTKVIACFSMRNLPEVADDAAFETMATILSRKVSSRLWLER